MREEKAIYASYKSRNCLRQQMCVTPRWWLTELCFCLHQQMCVAHRWWHTVMSPLCCSQGAGTGSGLSAGCGAMRLERGCNIQYQISRPKLKMVLFKSNFTLSDGNQNQFIYKCFTAISLNKASSIRIYITYPYSYLSKLNSSAE